LDAAMQHGGPVLAPLELDARTASRQVGLGPFFRSLVGATELRVSKRRDPSGSFRERLAALDEAQGRQLLLRLIGTQVAEIMRVSPELNPDQPLSELGMDSLMAVELRNRLQAETTLSLAATVLFDHPTPGALASHIQAKLGASKQAPKQKRSARARTDDAIAIVGAACHVPGGGESPEAMWQDLLGGVDATSGFPSDRGWPPDIHDFSPDTRGKSLTQRGGFLHDAAQFDATFFGISPREAVAIDPQQRLLLETTWEALERARIIPASLVGSQTGVYVGIMYPDYGARVAGDLEQLDGHIGLGSAPSVASGRLA
ncbi:MAG: type I polyketide synthase, partial [Myxococcales bacterium]|nr:type I polyketide synthase [Myxococcales bacterium]